MALASTAFLSAGQGRNCSLCDKDETPKQHKEPCIMLLKVRLCCQMLMTKTCSTLLNISVNLSKFHRT